MLMVSKQAIELIDALAQESETQAYEDLTDVLSALTMGQLLEMYNAFAAITMTLETKLNEHATSGRYQQFQSLLH